MEVEVWRAGGIRGPAVAGARGGKRSVEEAAGRGDAGQRGAEGSGVKKMVTPGAKRGAVAHAPACHGLSERRAEQPKIPAMRSIVVKAAEGCSLGRRKPARNPLSADKG